MQFLGALCLGLMITGVVLSMAQYGKPWDAIAAGMITLGLFPIAVHYGVTFLAIKPSVSSGLVFLAFAAAFIIWFIRLVRALQPKAPKGDNP